MDVSILNEKHFDIKLLSNSLLFNDSIKFFKKKQKLNKIIKIILNKIILIVDN